MTIKTLRQAPDNNQIPISIKSKPRITRKTRPAMLAKNAYNLFIKISFFMIHIESLFNLQGVHLRDSAIPPLIFHHSVLPHN